MTVQLLEWISRTHGDNGLSGLPVAQQQTSATAKTLTFHNSQVCTVLAQWISLV